VSQPVDATQSARPTLQLGPVREGDTASGSNAARGVGLDDGEESLLWDETRSGVRFFRLGRPRGPPGDNSSVSFSDIYRCTHTEWVQRGERRVPSVPEAEAEVEMEEPRVRA
jgi:hypothetical protein